MAVTREFERNLRDPAHFIAAVDLCVECVSVFDTARGSEINSAQKLAHDHQIHASNRIAAQRRTVYQRFEDSYRPQIGVISEELAKIQQPVFALFPRRQVVVLRITNRSEKNSVGFQA
jgi:hypothetical protein